MEFGGFVLEAKLDFRNTMLIIFEIFFITFITSFLLVVVSHSLNSKIENNYVFKKLKIKVFKRLMVSGFNKIIKF